MAAIAIAATMLTPAPAPAAVGYEPAASGSTIATGAELQHGIAIDQTSHEIHVAVLAQAMFEFGYVRRLQPDGTITGTFGGGSETVFSGVAVDQLTQGFYAARVISQSPFGPLGAARIEVFSSTGSPGTGFATSDTKGAPQIATDSTGLIYFPNAANDSVQVFDSSGALQETILCNGCPGGAFGEPMSVALDSDDDLYVVDLAPDRVVKFDDTASGYAYASVLQSGRGASGVGVDPSTDDVFVSDIASDGRHHIVAYDSAGVQFDDFGAGLAKSAFGQERLSGPQVAANATSHKLYVTSRNQLFVYDRVANAKLPAVVTDPASEVGQLEATLQATINANGHAVLDCDFEYVDDTEFLTEGFVNPDTAACSKNPDGTSDVAVSAGLTGLSPATKYHFRAVATSNAGTTTGGTQTFTTLPSVPPTVSTDQATGVSETAATLVGRVNPRGGTVSDCHFEYGTTSSYGTDVPCVPKPGPVNAEVTRTVALKGLPSGTTHHYRLVVTTNAGTTEGEDVTFTTASPPPPPPPPATPESPPPATTPAPESGPQLTPAITCRRGFRKVKRAGKVVCVKKRCRKGFVRKKVRGKRRCVKKKPRRHRAARRSHARAGRR